MSPLMSICTDCRKLTATRPRCPQCKRSYEARRNAEPNRAAHRTKLHESIRRTIFAEQDRCQNCGTTEQPTLDYIEPLEAGGLQVVENAQRLCRSCNSRKGARVVPSHA